MEVLRVKGLVNLLENLCRQRTINESSEVWLSSDEEGNSFSPLLNDPEISIGVEGARVVFYPSSLHEVTEL